MKKLLVCILTLLSTAPTFAMHVTKMSRLQQRAYATMTKKNFERLIGLQEDNYPLRSHIFASELVVMEKDDEDMQNLREHLLLQMNFVETERFEYNIERLISLPIGTISTLACLTTWSAIWSDIPEMTIVFAPLSIWGVREICKSLSRMKKNYPKYKAFNIYKKNLDHVNLLLEQKKRQDALAEIKDRYRE